MSTEVWRTVPGWDGYYEVSDQGNVRSVDRVVPNRPGVTMMRRGRLLKPTPSHDGYAEVWLSRDNKRTYARVSRLVAEAFHGPCPDGMECRHIDGDKSNNTAENLAWGTRSENTYDKVRHGTHPMSKKTHCLRGHPLSGSNVYHIKSGGRACKTCHNILRRQRRAQQKAMNQ